MIKNLTPHPVNLLTLSGQHWRTFLPEPVPARVDETPSELARLNAGLEFDCPCREASSYGALTGLPEPEDGVYLLVSALVLDALRKQGSKRRDVLGISWPDVVRHEDGPQKGQPKGTKAFVRL